MNTSAHDDAFSVAVVNPLQGPLGIIGPPAQLCAQLAAEEINAAGGILGRELRLLTVDGGLPPAVIAARVDALVSSGQAHSVIGTHTSSVRKAVAPTLAGRVPYVYTSLYEGGERDPGVFITGETPDTQLLPALTMLDEEFRVREWFVVGNDYIWPRSTAQQIRRHLANDNRALAGQAYVPLGCNDFTVVLDGLERSNATGVVVLLVGQDAVDFHRQFAERGLHHQMVRLSPLMDENMLLAAGAAASEQLYVGAAYFSTLPTQGSLDFTARYSRRFGPEAPMVGTMAESCYEGLHLLAALTKTAGSAAVSELCRVADDVEFEGPRGAQRLTAHHTSQLNYLAKASGLDFDVLASLSSAKVG
ncbi:substrate-binding domain-containing protein [Mycolicibacterium mengxianglii]|uniref:substrate-binding domain-containing protein n=1 Tax=Mycolicibacterium mengxianglii TaxID=2736649 RepID=UPI0018EEFBF6|nr:substrate-binding domain-containing protein [Mycolicibacterium mengxianglii]